MPKANLDFEQVLAEYDVRLRETGSARSRRKEDGGLLIVGVLLLVVIILCVFLSRAGEDVEPAMAIASFLFCVVGLLAMRPEADLQREVRRRHANGWQACGDCRGRGGSVEVDPLVPPFCEPRSKDVRVTVCATCHGYRWVRTSEDNQMATDDLKGPTS